MVRLRKGAMAARADVLGHRLREVEVGVLGRGIGIAIASAVARTPALIATLLVACLGLFFQTTHEYGVLFPPEVDHRGGPLEQRPRYLPWCSWPERVDGREVDELVESGLAHAATSGFASSIEGRKAEAPN